MRDYMNTGKWLLFRLKNLRMENVRRNIAFVQAASGKSSPRIFLDMVFCFVRYGAGYVDYQTYNFINLPAKQRNTYLTRNRCRLFLRKVNCPDYEAYFEDKIRFNRTFDKYLGRGWIDLSSASVAQIVDFLETHGQIYFLKPVDGECGIGIERIDLREMESDLYATAKKLKESGKALLEEGLVQHEQMGRLHPESVNCLRIVTMLDRENKPHLIYVMQKIGINHHFTDNDSIYSLVDPGKEEISSVGWVYSADGSRSYEAHPQLHYPIRGCHIPYLKEAVSLCLEAATVVPQQRYIGWDVAICPNGPVLVEGNNTPGCVLQYQYFCGSKRTEGLITEIEKYL